MVKATSEAVDVTLALVARGNAILAEIERLSDIIPLLFRGEIRAEESLVIFDSSYFKNIDGVEANIEKDPKLQDIDIRVKEEYLGTLTKFYQVHVPSVQTREVQNFFAVFRVHSEVRLGPGAAAGGPGGREVYPAES